MQYTLNAWVIQKRSFMKDFNQHPILMQTYYLYVTTYVRMNEEFRTKNIRDLQSLSEVDGKG